MSDFNDKVIKEPGFGYVGDDINAVEIPEKYKIEDIDSNESVITIPIIEYFIGFANNKTTGLSESRLKKLILLCHQFIVENRRWIEENNISNEQIALAIVFSYLSFSHLILQFSSRKFVEQYFKIFRSTVPIGTFTVDSPDGNAINKRTREFNDFSEKIDMCILKISEYDSDPGSNFSLLLTKILGGGNKNKKLILKGTKRMKRNMKTRKSRKMRNKKTQRMYLQKGCAKLKLKLSKKRRGHSARCRCKICGLQNGGCGCGISLPQLGGCGCGLKGGGGVPAPLVGSSWTPQISGWPGVAGLPGQTNYLSLNEYKGGDPQTQGIQFNRDTMSPTKGGGRGRGRGKKGGSGTLIPQDLVNLGRTLTYGLGSAYNNINGYAQPISPLPFQDQLRNVAYSRLV
jgi:hypothetical protein